jgi:Ca-activated chloride channel family protein
MRSALAAASVAAMLASSPAGACDVALVLLIDVSGSVDPAEFRLQVDGLADALRDPVVIDALLAAQAALEVVQWSGGGMQTTVLSWQRMLEPADVAAFSDAARAMGRAYDGSDTAVGDALAYAATRFGEVADCRRRVIDISGDGDQNAGGPLVEGRAAALGAGAAINAVAIEDVGIAVTEFYRRHVISRGGFVLTARGHLDYPRAIRLKIEREVEKPAF